ncbi:MAG: NACHT domain-containing protein [Chloroflexi bacterium]|nr:NACHT domain-containing protein [Chloroflexota bacterium]
MVNAEISHLAQARLRHHLETQSAIIEETMSRYCQRPLTVTGGDVRSNYILYDMLSKTAPVLPTPAIERDLQRRLGAAARLSRWSGGLRVTVERPSPPVDLLTLMQTYNVPQVGALTAMLGLDNSGRPVQLNLARAGHILLAGEAGSGKTALLQTTAVSLALANQPRQIQFLVIKNLADETPWPRHFLTPDYLLRPVVATVAEAAKTLGILAGRLEQMPVAGRQGLRLVLIIDRVEALLTAARFAALAPLARLLETDDLTLLVSSQQPQNDWLRYCGDRWGTRIAGRTTDAVQAEAASGFPHSGAENLPGDGAYLLAKPGEKTARYFQAATVDRYDLGFLAGERVSGWASERGRPGALAANDLPTHKLANSHTRNHAIMSS